MHYSAYLTDPRFHIKVTAFNLLLSDKDHDEIDNILFTKSNSYPDGLIDIFCQVWFQTKTSPGDENENSLRLIFSLN